jgi:tRNA pseudouridine38-40 synthase
MLVAHRRLGVLT